MKKYFIHIRNIIFHRFNLQEDKQEEQIIVESIKRDVEFKGANLWALIFAIVIASVGLNIGSIPVIIGAMLISPLMGPIMGIGLSIGINDFDLLKRGINNLLIASIISIAASAIYFSITPIHETNPELLARTNPSIWDVFIAFFGGFAGIVAGTRKEKGNVIPGVAIATALMPPLCTAGYGLATLQWYYLLGALYLFFINSLMICVATYLIVKNLKFHPHEFATRKQEKKVTRIILLIVFITIMPSIYLAYEIVQRNIFENKAKEFVQNEFHFSQTMIVSKNFVYNGRSKSIQVLLLGSILSSTTVDSLKARLPLYGLDSTRLIIHQGLDAKKEIDLAQIKASILEEVFSNRQKADTIVSLHAVSIPEPELPDLKKELRALYPTLKTFSLSRNVIQNLDTTLKDTIINFTGSFSKPLGHRSRIQLYNWLRERIHADTLKLELE